MRLYQLSVFTISLLIGMSMCGYWREIMWLSANVCWRAGNVAPSLLSAVRRGILQLNGGYVGYWRGASAVSAPT